MTLTSGKISAPILGFLMISAAVAAQDGPRPLPEAPVPRAEFPESAEQNPTGVQDGDSTSRTDPTGTAKTGVSAPASLDAGGKFSYFLKETYGVPAALTAPAFRAGIRMAHAPGKGATEYPPEWRQGAEAFGRNYGDAFAQRSTAHFARFATGVITHEDPRYTPSASSNFLARTAHAVAFTFIDRSDSGHHMLALSNFAGAAAGGFVGNAYLPPGYDNATHAGQRATIHFATFAGGNLFREFAPQIPRPIRAVLELVAR